MIENDDGAGLSVLTPEQAKKGMALQRRLDALDPDDPDLQAKIDAINTERLALADGK